MKQIALLTLMLLTACGPIRRTDANFRRMMDERREALPGLGTDVPSVPKVSPPAPKSTEYQGDLCWLNTPQSHNIDWESCYDESGPTLKDKPTPHWKYAPSSIFDHG